MILCGDWAPQNELVSIELEGRENMVFNLEGPLAFSSFTDFAAIKAGPHLINNRLPSITGNAIYVMANNHVMDYGAEGLNHSFAEVSKTGGKHVGAGNNLNEARKPLIINENGLKIGIVACCEHQFGIAGQNNPGMAEMGPWIYAMITSLQAEVDYVIISVHSGLELSPLPTPFHRELYKSYVDAGANLIYAHHAHVPQAFEIYNGAHIFYGLGNFAVDRISWQSLPNALWSIGIQLNVVNEKFELAIKTFEINFQAENQMKVSFSSDSKKEANMNCLAEYEEVLKNETLYEAVNQEICIDAFTQYGSKYIGISVPVLPKSHRIKALARKILRVEEASIKGLTPKKALLRKVMISCESHRQMLITALQVLSGEINDLRTEESRQWVQKFTPR